MRSSEDALLRPVHPSALPSQASRTNPDRVLCTLEYLCALAVITMLAVSLTHSQAFPSTQAFPHSQALAPCIRSFLIVCPLVDAYASAPASLRRGGHRRVHLYLECAAAGVQETVIVLRTINPFNIWPVVCCDGLGATGVVHLRSRGHGPSRQWEERRATWRLCGDSP